MKSGNTDLSHVDFKFDFPSPMHQSATRRWLIVAKIALVAAIYFVSGKFGLKLAFIYRSATPVWPPTGIAIASLLLLGSEIWPAVWLGAFLVNITTAGSVMTTLAIASGNTLEAVLAASLVKWVAGGRGAFDRAADVFTFVILAAALSTAVSATVGVTSLALGGFVPWNQYGAMWVIWWLGDAMSALFVTPLILIWSAPSSPRWDRWQTAEFVLILATALGIGSVAFGRPAGVAFSRYVRFLLYPIVIWAAYRFRQRGAVSAVLVVVCLGIWGTLHGLGPFAVKDRNESLVLLQVFIAALGSTSLILAALVSERQQAEDALRREQDLTRRDLADMAVLQQCGARLVKGGDVQAMLEQIVEAAIDITSADRGNIQLLDVESGMLLIAAQRGFQKPFLDFFAATRPGHAACGAAMQRGARVTVEDVLRSELFAAIPAQEVLIAAGVRAVQSTPLLNRSGELVGVLSTHFSQPHKPDPRRMQSLDLLTRQAADFIERCRIEAKVRDKEAQLRLVTDITPVMLVRCSRDQRFIFVNRAYAKMLGRSPEEINGKSIREVVGDAAYQRVLPYIETVLQGQPVEYEEEVPYQGIGPRFLRAAGVPDINPQGEVVGWVASISDLTEHRQAQANAQAEKYLSDTIINTLPGVFYLFDQTGRFLRWNRNLEVVSGYSADEVARLHPLDFFEGQDKDLVQERIEEVFSKGQSFAEGEIISKTGKRTPYYFTSVRLTIANRPCLVGLGIDITERKRAEQALRVSQARYAQLIESAMDAIITVDAQQQIVMFNPAAERMFGRPATEALGQPIDQFIPERFRDVHRRHVQKFGKRGVTNRRMGALGALSARRVNGEEFPIEASISHMEVGGQQLFTVILRDITERKQTEAALEAWRRELESRVEERTIELTIAHKQLQAQIEERKRLETEMARAVEREQLRLGHELHDGLGQQLAGMSYMMTALAKKLEKESGRGSREAQRLETLLLHTVDQARNLAKGFYPVELDRHGLLAALEEMIHSNKQTFGVRGVLESDGSTVADQKGPVAVQLFRIAQEAMHNAMKHARAKQVLVRLSTVEDRVVLVVKDDGVGLPAGAGQASGMGLRIMRYRAHLIGGTLDVVNPPEGGVMVTCAVPRPQEAAQAPVPTAAPASATRVAA
jgi:PAS domain S-box-containing protein